MPTVSIEEQARQFVIERVALQNAAVSRMDTLVRKAIQQIVDISRKYRIPPSRFSFSADTRLKRDVDAVISALLEDILSDIEYRVTYDIQGEEDKHNIILWLLLAFKGKNIRQRLSSYLQDLLSDILPQVAAATIGSKSSSVYSIEIFNSLTHPETSSLYREAEANGYPGTERKRSPVGIYVYAYNNLKRAVSDQVARTRQRVYYDIQHKQTTQWLVMRGSRYPCSLCDSMCGITTKPENLPPFHPNCCCFAVPLD